MADLPILVEILRGGRIESAHRGSASVVDADGCAVLELGDVARPIYPRSAVKAFQTLPLIESGAADRFGLTDAEIALACASHAGTPAHVAVAASILARAGRGAEALECGAHWPMSETAARALASEGGAPSALHNNCSGKHAGMICVACALGLEPKGYVAPAHLVQREVTAALADVTGAPCDETTRAVDGCSLPAYAIPLRSLAHGFARFGTGRGLPPQRARAAARIRAAVAAHPEMVSGAGRFDTEAMRLAGRRLFVKGGAEGVVCAALPDAGLGLAVKIDDGAQRAATAAMAALLLRFGRFDDREADRLAALGAPAVRNWNGIETGRIAPAGPLA